MMNLLQVTLTGPHVENSTNGFKPNFMRRVVQGVRNSLIVQLQRLMGDGIATLPILPGGIRSVAVALNKVFSFSAPPFADPCHRFWQVIANEYI